MITINYRIGIALEQACDYKKSHFWITIGIVINLFPLILFKYGAFFANNAIWLFVEPLDLFRQLRTVKQFNLPLGISFYTFHSLSYLIDVYRKDVRAERSLRDLAVYICMFPQLVAGPIIRFKTISRDLHYPNLSVERASKGVCLFIIGLSQKVLIANPLGDVTDRIVNLLPLDHLSTSLAWFGIACYTLQIYYDFGGYSLMAIGLGLIIGFTFPPNFNYPYFATSMTDFWRRWHISLSSWFRDYVYIPLGGNRGSAARTYVNLWIVFVLCGLWHGAAWNFLIWGAAHGQLLVLERIGFRRWLERQSKLLQHSYVVTAVMLTWVLFRAPTLRYAGSYLLAMAGQGASESLAPRLGQFLHADVVLAICFGLLAATPYGLRFAAVIDARLVIGSLRVGLLVSLFALFSLATLSLAGGAYNPFIYFRF